MKSANISGMIVLACLLAACTYSDSDVYYANPIPGDTATLVVSTNLDTLDPVVIADSLLIKYRAEIENGKLYFTSASIDAITFYQYYTEYDPDTINGPYVLTDSFWIWSNPANDSGLYTLIFSAYYSSNTNSLGDKLGLEADLLNLEFDLFVEGGGK